MEMKLPTNISPLSRFLACKICWKITIWIFISILIVEAIILIPSYKNHEIDELRRIEKEAIGSMKTLLHTVDLLNMTPQQQEEILEEVFFVNPITGLILSKDDSEQTIKFGEQPATNPEYKRIEHGTRLDVYWNKNKLMSSLNATVRLDTSSIDRLLLKFVLRIIGLVAIITFFVTIVSVFVIRKIILKRILCLREKAIHAASDSDNPTHYLYHSDINDEIGDLIYAFNVMLEHIGIGLDKLETVNTDLEKKVNERTKELIQEIEERKHYEKELIQLANYDPVTELPNKNLFWSKSAQLISEIVNSNKILAIYLLELNEFQEINDAYGSTIGDLLLKKTGQFFDKNISHIATVGRFGSHQLAILTEPCSDLEQIEDIAVQILEKFSRPFEISSQNIATTVNIGVVLIPADGTDPKALLSNADMALQRSKKIQSNSYQYYEKDMNKIIENRHSILVDLHYAIDHEQFEIYYQPQIDLNSSKIIGMEALLRWKHPEKGFISPVEFIPIAEESGLIIPIGNWVFKKACEQNKKWLDEGISLRVGINLSPIQFHHRDLVADMEKVLEDTQLPSSNVEIEITETAIANDIDEAIRITDHIHSLGIIVAMDDFGTGHASLANLRRFPIQSLKIDQSFVRVLHPNDPEENLAGAIIHIGHSLGLKIIAEGVETKFQMEYLKDLGCEEIQGYYIAKPMPAEEFINFVKKYNND